MKKATLLASFLLMATLFVAPAPTAAEETGLVGEVFLCTFHDGKGWDDLDVAIDAYNEAVANAEIETPANEFIWRPLRAQVEFDFLWAAYHQNMNAWGQGLAAYLESEEGPTADALFESVIDCDSAMTLVELIYDSEGLQQASRNSSRPNALESYVCSLNEGKTWEDLMAATEQWHAYVTELASPMDVYRRTPFIGTTAEVDVSYFAVHPDIETFAKSSSDYLTGSRAAEVQAALDAVQTCRSGLWTSWQVSPAAE